MGSTVPPPPLDLSAGVLKGRASANFVSHLNRSDCRCGVHPPYPNAREVGAFQRPHDAAISAHPSSDHFSRGGHDGQQDFVLQHQEQVRANRHANEAGGRAYKFTPKHALAQMAATGCFNGVYYASAESQLDEMRKLIDQVDDNVFLAKLAVYARERAYMKDMPAALLVVLSKRDTELMHRVFDRVVDNGRVLRTMFQMIRSGQFGRTSLSSPLAAGVPAVAERGIGRQVAVGVDR